MSKSLLRIPYTAPLPPPLTIPTSAATLSGTIAALTNFLHPPTHPTAPKLALLTGAGISVASGLADYRGSNGTYIQNPSYRPIYYHEFTSSHLSRKRYWARSFLGYRPLSLSKPNATHYAIRDLAAVVPLRTVITQNVDSFHTTAHPDLHTIELHGYLRSLVCLSCRRLYPRDKFQSQLSALNPAWKVFLAALQESGALDTENPAERRKKGYRTNPDGDADVPGAPYPTFRYPACPHCLSRSPIMKDGSKGVVKVDSDGGWSTDSSEGAGVLKPNVIMFGESIPEAVKLAVETAVLEADRLLVIGSSLATYSAWRLAKLAREKGKKFGILNVGGVRKENAFFCETGSEEVSQLYKEGDGSEAFRGSWQSEEVLPRVVEELRLRGSAT